jgi:tripartite-type tricarboxylate transporter receptor subunit TctC
VPSWYTVVAPARTPRPVADRLRGELKRIADHADFREQLARQAIDARTLAPGEWSAFIKAELAKWGEVVMSVGIKPD